MPTGTRAGKERKRRTVASGVIAGQATDQIAAAAGCKSRYVQRLANDPETQFLITEALAPHRAKLARMAVRAVNTVDKALIAKRSDKRDHMVCLRAVERYGELLALAAGKPKDAAADDGTVTWEQFTLMYEKRTVTAA
jgi:hypothetical protein